MLTKNTNEAIDRQFTMEVDLDDVVVLRMLQVHRRLLLPPPLANRRNLPRIAAFVKKGPPEGMVNIEEVPITQLDALGANTRGHLTMMSTASWTQKKRSHEKLRHENETTGTEVSPSTVGSKESEGICAYDMDFLPQAKETLC